MINYLGKDLYTKIDKVIGKAFRENFIESKDVYYNIDEISLDYSVSESDYDLPLVEVIFNIIYQGEMTDISTYYFLNKSEEYNAGYISCKIWEAAG